MIATASPCIVEARPDRRAESRRSAIGAADCGSLSQSQRRTARCLAAAVVDDEDLILDVRPLKLRVRASTVSLIDSTSLWAGITTDSFSALPQRSAFCSRISRRMASMS